jgi:hypothetical protein
MEPDSESKSHVEPDKAKPINNQVVRARSDFERKIQVLNQFVGQNPSFAEQ